VAGWLANLIQLNFSRIRRMTMFKKLMFAVVPVLVLAGSAFADDDAAISIDASTITVADANVVDAALDINVDQLASDAGKESKVDAIEACFRRCGYSNYGWGGSYNSCYNSYCSSPYFSSCYQPYYSYTSYCCARPLYYATYVCQPVCQYYWGCY
jgi:hypothetical protein